MKINLTTKEVKTIMDIITEVPDYNSQTEKLWDKIAKQYYKEVEQCQEKQTHFTQTC